MTDLHTDHGNHQREEGKEGGKKRRYIHTCTPTNVCERASGCVCVCVFLEEGIVECKGLNWNFVDIVVAYTHKQIFFYSM